MDSCLGNPRRREEVLNLGTIHLNQVQNLSTHPRHFNLHNYPDLARHHLVLLPEVKLQQKDAIVVISFILGLAMHLKCVISVDRQAMLRSSV